MSAPGNIDPSTDPNLQAYLSPDQVQQMRDHSNRLRMAAMLMGNQANNQTPYAGIANMGSSLAGALMAKQANDRYADQLLGIGPVDVTPQVGTTALSRAGSWLGKNLFGLGGNQ